MGDLEFGISLRFGACSLELVCFLVLGICDFRHKTPRQSQISLTPAMRDRLGPEVGHNKTLAGSRVRYWIASET